jgi:hypothetical protein
VSRFCGSITAADNINELSMPQFQHNLRKGQQNCVKIGKIDDKIVYVFAK